MGYPKKDYKFVRFEKSKTEGKKYDAIIQNRETGREKRIPFGASSYEQYKDSTGLGLYSHKDHLDKKRRDRYKARHKVYYKPNQYSPAYFSWRFLW
jgi:hypothetical protein